MNVPYTWSNETGGNSPETLFQLFTSYKGFPNFVQQHSVESMDTYLLDTSDTVHTAYSFNYINYEDGQYDVTLLYNQTSDLSLPVSLSMLGEAILRQEMQDSGAQWQVNEQPLTNAMSFSAIAFLFY